MKGSYAVKRTAVPRRKALRSLIAVFAVIAIAAAACLIYIGNYYHTDESAVQAFAHANSFSDASAAKNMRVYGAAEARCGLIFYPGGKVQFDAYEPLMQACAAKGIHCVLLKMPGNLAVLDINAANGIREMFPEIKNWYIGGHSLGGSMAAAYLGKHKDAFDGLILLSAYSTEELSACDLDVLSVYGSEDGVLNAEKYSESLANLPADFTEIVIPGGCHAYFGMYGPQKGDGTPTISSEEQILFTAETIADFAGIAE